MPGRPEPSASRSGSISLRCSEAVDPPVSVLNVDKLGPGGDDSGGPKSSRGEYNNGLEGEIR
eukprot:8592833-Alexandrium_andersonii.AAC.1